MSAIPSKNVPLITSTTREVRITNSSDFMPSAQLSGRLIPVM